jgi:hypothetical protein
MNSKDQSVYHPQAFSMTGVHRSGRLGRLLVACATGAALFTTLSSNAHDLRSRLEGVWKVTRHGVDCQTGEQRSTFMAITTFARGETVTGFGVPPGSTPAQTSPEYGVWRHLGGPDYEFRLLSYGYDASGALSGMGDVAGQLELDHDADRFTYTSKITFLDAVGNRLFTACGAGTGERYGLK